MRVITPSRPGYRIGVVVPNLNGGGAERVMAIMANAFAHVGYEVDLIAGRLAGPYIDLIEAPVRTYDLRSNSMTAALPGIISYLRTQRPDALLASQNWVNVVTMLANRTSHASARIVLREGTHPEGEMRHGDSVRLRALRKLTARTYRRADAVVAVSEEVKEYIVAHMGIDPSRAHVIYGPHFDDRALAAAQQDTRHELSLIHI